VTSVVYGFQKKGIMCMLVEREKKKATVCLFVYSLKVSSTRPHVFKWEIFVFSYVENKKSYRTEGTKGHTCGNITFYIVRTHKNKKMIFVSSSIWVFLDLDFHTHTHLHSVSFIKHFAYSYNSILIRKLTVNSLTLKYVNGFHSFRKYSTLFCVFNTEKCG